MSEVECGTPPELRLSAQRALLGAVTPAVYGVCVDLRAGRCVLLSFYVAPTMSPDEREGLQVVGSEIAADCPDDWIVEDRFVVVADGQSLETAGAWVHLQRGVRTFQR